MAGTCVEGFANLGAQLCSKLVALRSVENAVSGLAEQAGYVFCGSCRSSKLMASLLSGRPPNVFVNVFGFFVCAPFGDAAFVAEW